MDPSAPIMTTLTIVALSLLAGDAEALAPEGTATLILTGGKVWTGDPSLPRAEAIAISGDRVLAVGGSSEIARLGGARTRVIDLRGRLVVPGFIDAHVHLVSGGDELLAPDLRSAPSEEEFARRVGEAAGKLPEGAWVTGGALDHESWPGAALPGREALDRFAPRHPVFVSRLDGHMAVANSLAIRIAGVSAETPDPPGGEIVRDPATGEPAGVFKDAAMALFSRHVPPLGREARRERALAALRHAASLGVTGVHDMGTSAADLRTLQELRSSGELTLRVTAYLPIEALHHLREAGIASGFGDERLKVGGLKAFADGSLGSSTALFLEPYSDDGDPRTPAGSGLAQSDLAPEGELARAVRDGLAAGLPPAIHAIGDLAIRRVLDILAGLEPSRGKGIAGAWRPRIEHAQHIHPDDLGRFAELGVVASMQPSHAADDGRWAERRIGPERCETTYAFRDLLDRGAELAFGSDWPVAPLSPLLGIEAAVTRRTLDGKHPEGWIPRQKISVEEALRAYTVGTARAACDEGRVGSLRPGSLADIAVLSEDIFEIDPGRIGKVAVDLTVVGGRVVFEREGEFRFVIMNDTHVRDERCVALLRKAFAKIRALEEEGPVDFALIAGDLTASGDPREFELLRGALAELGMPVHAVPGNHDYRGEDRSAYDAAFPGHRNRSFAHRGWTFLGFDSCDGSSWWNVRVGAETLAWLRSELAGIPRESPLVVFTHFPLGEGVTWRSANADEVLELLSGHRLVRVASGHFHGLTEVRWREATLATGPCLAVSRENHDGSAERGFFICAARDGKLSTRFVPVTP